MSSPSEPDELWPTGPEPGDPDPPPLLVIVDTSLVIEIKIRIPVGDQWRLLNRMLRLVEAGFLAFPRKVHRELTAMRWPDAPGAWCGEAVKVLQFPDPEDASVAAVLRQAPNLIEQDADDDKADPYVVAMAHELTHGDPPYDVAVATTDCVDHLPLKIAMTTACDRLSIPCWDFDAFVAWVNGFHDDDFPQA